MVSAHHGSCIAFPWLPAPKVSDSARFLKVLKKGRALPFLLSFLPPIIWISAYSEPHTVTPSQALGIRD